jgi:hypothetical protein
MTAMGGTRHLELANALPAAVPAGLVAAVRGAAAAELARRLGPARLFTPSEDDQALVWAVISERLAEAHREHVLAGNTPLNEHEQQRVAQALAPWNATSLAMTSRSCSSTGTSAPSWSAPAAPKTGSPPGSPRRRSCGRSPPAPSRSPAAAWTRPTPKPTRASRTGVVCM